MSEKAFDRFMKDPYGPRGSHSEVKSWTGPGISVELPKGQDPFAEDRWTDPPGGYSEPNGEWDHPVSAKKTQGKECPWDVVEDKPLKTVAVSGCSTGSVQPKVRSQVAATNPSVTASPVYGQQAVPVQQYQDAPMYFQSGYAQPPVPYPVPAYVVNADHGAKVRTRHLRNKVRLAVYIVAVVAVVSAALYVVYDLNGQSLDLSDREARIIVTNSMDGEPTDYPISTIPVNAMVMIERLDDSEKSGLKVGDILSFYNARGMLINHRIIEVQPTLYKTHGDNTHATETVTYDMIHGHVVGVSSWLGETVVFIQQNTILVVFALLVIIGGISAISWLLRQEVSS